MKSKKKKKDGIENVRVNRIYGNNFYSLKLSIQCTLSLDIDKLYATINFFMLSFIKIEIWSTPTPLSDEPNLIDSIRFIITYID